MSESELTQFTEQWLLHGVLSYHFPRSYMFCLVVYVTPAAFWMDNSDPTWNVISVKSSGWLLISMVLETKVI